MECATKKIPFERKNNETLVPDIVVISVPIMDEEKILQKGKNEFCSFL